MAKTWVVVAHRAGARIYENDGPGKGLRMLQEIAHPEGRLQDKELETDRPGRTFDRVGPGTRHAQSRQVTPSEHVAELWAKELAAVVEQGRTEQRYDRLVLVAEPRFLGRLQAQLGNASGAVVATLKKNLIDAGPQEIVEQVGEVIAV